MTRIISPAPQFASLTEAEVTAALDDPDPRNPIAVEVARMTEREIEQDRNCHYDLQSSRGELASRAKESATQPSEARQSKVKHLARVSERLIPLEKKEIGILREARGE